MQGSFREGVSSSSSAQANQVDADVASCASIDMCRGQQVAMIARPEDALGRADDAPCEVGVVLIGHGLGPSTEDNSCLIAMTLKLPHLDGCVIYHIA